MSFFNMPSGNFPGSSIQNWGENVADAAERAGEAEPTAEYQFGGPLTYTPEEAPTPTELTTSNSIDGFLANAESLSAEALLIYCATQLSSLDQDIKAFMNNQRSMNAKKKIYQELKSKLDANNLVSKNEGQLKERVPAMLDAYQKAYDELMSAGLKVEAAQLNDHMKKYFPNSDLSTGTHSAEGRSDFKEDSTHAGMIEPFESVIDDLTKNSELNMLQLQSIMSQRQTALQLTTNMLDKFNKGLDQIAANFK